MATVRRWTGHEAHALRIAKRMGVLQFAEHLGVAPAAVSKWERRGAAARLRYETQQILDVDLARAPDDVCERFGQSLDTQPPPQPSSADASTHAAPTQSGAPSDLGERSATRTRALLDATAALRAAPPPYRAPMDAVTLFEDFLASPCPRATGQGTSRQRKDPPDLSPARSRHRR